MLGKGGLTAVEREATWEPAQCTGHRGPGKQSATLQSSVRMCCESWLRM